MDAFFMYIIVYMSQMFSQFAMADYMSPSIKQNVLLAIEKVAPLLGSIPQWLLIMLMVRMVEE